MENTQKEETKMKKKLSMLLCLALALCTMLGTTAMAATPSTTDGPTVRVNGEVVDFPDGKPYVDENARTLIPVRFVTEALGKRLHLICHS